MKKVQQIRMDVKIDEQKDSHFVISENDSRYEKIC